MAALRSGVEGRLQAAHKATFTAVEDHTTRAFVIIKEKSREVKTSKEECDHSSWCKNRKQLNLDLVTRTLN